MCNHRRLLLEEASDGRNFAFWPLKRYNHNVVINWLLKGSAGCADSVWSNTVLAAYLYQLMGNSNAYAGYVEAAQGISTLFVALPAGWLADRGSKSSVVWWAGTSVPLAIGTTAFAVVYGVAHSQASERAVCFATLAASLCLWGAVQAVQNGVAQALYADSIRAGERSRFYSISFSVGMLASTLGPLVTIVIFLSHGAAPFFSRGDEDVGWSLPVLRNVFLAGLGLEIFPAICMLCFRDRCALEKREPSPPGGSINAVTTSSAPAVTATQTDAASAETSSTEGQPGEVPQHRLAHLVPHIVFASNLLLGLASGMTIKVGGPNLHVSYPGRMVGQAPFHCAPGVSPMKPT